MTKDILLTVSGLHRDLKQGEAENADPVTLKTDAKYYYKNNRHYVLYDELQEDNSISHNTLVFKEDYMSLVKRGDIDARILIETGKHHSNAYSTGAGILQISMEGEKVLVKEDENQIRALASYKMRINDEHVADCELSLLLFAKEDEKEVQDEKEST
jgi:uncharacterized beta-barrel protein YwiB (DUF1934 family)